VPKKEVKASVESNKNAAIPEHLEGRIATDFVGLASLLLGYTVDLGHANLLVVPQQLGGGFVLGLFLFTAIT